MRLLSKKQKAFYNIHKSTGEWGSFWAGNCPTCQLELVAAHIDMTQTAVVEGIKRHERAEHGIEREKIASGQALESL